MTVADISLVTHTSVNRTKWDECVMQSGAGLPCGLAWYLDIVSPGWEGLVAGNYDAVFPLTGRRKYSIRYLAQPFFAQQLGIFGRPGTANGMTAAMLRAIPEKYRLVEICLNETNAYGLESFAVRQNDNYVLDLSKPHPALTGSYAENTRRSITKADRAGISVRTAEDPGAIIALFRTNRGRQVRHWGEREYKTLGALVPEAARRSAVTMLEAYGRDGSVCAGAVFLEATSRTVFLFSGAGQRARETGAMACLMDRYIAAKAGQPGALLDFEGSNDAGLARFYRGFGAANRPYPLMKINRLPWFVRWVKR